MARASTPFALRFDTYTSAGNGVIVDMSRNPVKEFAVQVVIGGTPGALTSWDVRVEGSLDGVNFSEIVRHTTASFNGVVAYSANDSLCSFFRSRCVSLTLDGATNIKAHILGGGQ